MKRASRFGGSTRILLSEKKKSHSRCVANWRTDFRIHDVANYQQAVRCDSLDGSLREVGERLIGDQDVEQDVGIERGQHRLKLAANVVHESVDGRLVFRRVALLRKTLRALTAPLADTEFDWRFFQDDRNHSLHIKFDPRARVNTENFSRMCLWEL